MSHRAWGPHTEWDKRKAAPTAPMPMQIPRGYTSGFARLESSLDDLWKDEKKFLKKYHVPFRSAKDKRKDNLLGLEFNPDVPKD